MGLEEVVTVVEVGDEQCLWVLEISSKYSPDFQKAAEEESASLGSSLALR